MHTKSAIGDGTSAHATSGKGSSEDLGRALLASISSGDRRAIEKLYASYFSILAKFFLELNVRADFIEDQIIDTMVDLWKEGASIGANVSVSVEIMRLAYSNGQSHLAKAAETQSEFPRDKKNDEQLLRMRLAGASLYLAYGAGVRRVSALS